MSAVGKRCGIMDHGCQDETAARGCHAEPADDISLYR